MALFIYKGCAGVPWSQFHILCWIADQRPLCLDRCPLYPRVSVNVNNGYQVHDQIHCRKSASQLQVLLGEHDITTSNEATTVRM